MKPIGQIGEEMAAEFLKKQKYKIVERNFRIRGGEIDIIALDGKTLVYIEVKTRTSHQFGLPAESVTPSKLNFLIRAAKFYRNNRGYLSLPEAERIDLVAVDFTSGEPNLQLIKNITF
ncbi:YraN family protein [Candidatus Curtissbacteria bacterium]|nr:YraN family protein [Candidatus Curtissbacteria bacterium]